jgi:hypothetical protein
MADGSECELHKGHDGAHALVKLDEDELADLELDDDALAALLGETRSPGIRLPEQIVIDGQVAANHAAWVAAGSNAAKPLWKVKAVAIHKRDETEKMLRKAAEFQEPQVGMRIKMGPIREGKATVIWAAVKRMERETDEAQTSEATADAS